MIGSKQLAPSELLASCIARIESVDHAVNAMVARDFARAHAAALKRRIRTQRPTRIATRTGRNPGRNRKIMRTNAHAP